MSLLLLLNPKYYVDAVRVIHPSYNEPVKEVESDIESSEITDTPKTDEISTKSPEIQEKVTNYRDVSRELIELEKQIAIAEHGVRMASIKAQIEQLQRRRQEIAHQILRMEEEEYALIMLLLD